MKRRQFIQRGAGALAITGAAVLVPVTRAVIAPARTNRILSETRQMEQVGDELISVHRIRMVVDFEPGILCDIPDSRCPRGTRRIIFSYFDGEWTQEGLEASLKSYRSFGFDSVNPGPDMPAPMGFFVSSRWKGKEYYSGGVSGYDLTSANIIMFAPAKAVFGGGLKPNK